MARLLLGPTARGDRLAVSSMLAVEINGQPGALLFDPNGRPVVAVSVDIADDLVQTVRAVSNPEKLRHLGPVADPGRLHRLPNIPGPQDPEP